MTLQLDLFRQSIERQDMPFLEGVSTSNLSRLMGINTDVPTEYRELLKQKLDDMPFTVRHETDKLHQILAIKESNLHPK